MNKAQLTRQLVDARQGVQQDIDSVLSQVDVVEDAVGLQALKQASVRVLQQAASALEALADVIEKEVR